MGTIIITPIRKVEAIAENNILSYQINKKYTIKLSHIVSLPKNETERSKLVKSFPP